MPGPYERARGGATEVDRAQLAYVQGKVGLAVRGDAGGPAVPDGQQVAATKTFRSWSDVERISIAAASPGCRHHDPWWRAPVQR
ncbi:hypothetical protein Cme02nite_33020 [Catellatospora methionotrophica]|uniref:Uncharacterized protein n=1 Tax=Catellatospora methionotrophica TaxID=121620 RepID=A0A8J3LLP8_9ACTN|nr:hypothetical protein Cme02nite_33020 [Catellatospora methionotrophica]